MAGMFPTMVSDPNDPNRRRAEPVGDTWPAPLRRAHRLVVAAAVLMLVAGMVMLAAGFPEGADEAFRAAFMRNIRFAAWSNIVLGLALGAAAAYLQRGSKVARRWVAVFSAAAIFINIAAFALRVTSWASFVIVVVLAVALWLAFRPASNAYVDEKHSLWRGLK